MGVEGLQAEIDLLKGAEGLYEIGGRDGRRKLILLNAEPMRG